MALRMYSSMSTVMRNLRGRRFKNIITMVTFTHCISCRKSSLLPYTKNMLFGNISQAQKMALSGDVTDQTAVKEITFNELQEQLNNNDITLVDVREPKELKKDGRIPKSINIPFGDVKGAFSLSPEKFQQKYGIALPDENDANLVFSCQSGRRAALATEELRKLGYLNCRCYCGSFLDWKAKGGQIVIDDSC